MPKDNHSSQTAPSREYVAWLRHERNERIFVVAWRIAILLGFLALWEILPRAGLMNPLFTSYPSAIWPTFLDMLPNTAQQVGILTHAMSTLIVTVLGFSAAMFFGIAIAAALWWSDRLYNVLDPYMVVANAVPKVAFVPIFYIWLGATLSVYAMSLAISLFITILMIYSGFKSIDPNRIKLAQVLGARKIQVFNKVVLPGSVPTLIATLKVNAGLSLVGTVVGEFQSANLGLGYLIQYGSQIFKMNIVMTSITLLAIISSLMYIAIAQLEKAIMRRR